ncbi:MAG: hypothetical protein MJA83_08220 [Gammaproteobacteria bacterium]|nr:hypothetical protein [Gammaproteobacteria bacterium]
MNIRESGGGTMRRIEASDSNVLSLIARLSVSDGRILQAKELIERLEDPSLAPVAEAIISGDESNPIAESYLRWATDIRLGSNGSLAKREELLSNAE